MWKFGQTRFVIALTLMALSMFFQFAGPSLVLKAILDYIKVKDGIKILHLFVLKVILDFIKEPSAPLSTGIILVFCLFLAQVRK